ncbi:hypothetical protein C2845_PM07G21190 [Panicum miliaceum]|uniref:Uncharacterized protein n=1 Tax=Panicum miliaceum TaxID=4540 RepID=A0A3L6ST28_PANMI|nr:hypothetical protein C2845_PM07G21190 [Panicum miliaceum]
MERAARARWARTAAGLQPCRTLLGAEPAVRRDAELRELRHSLGVRAHARKAGCPGGLDPPRRRRIRPAACAHPARPCALVARLSRFAWGGGALPVAMRLPVLLPLLGFLLLLAGVARAQQGPLPSDSSHRHNRPSRNKHLEASFHAARRRARPAGPAAPGAAAREQRSGPPAKAAASAAG